MFPLDRVLVFQTNSLNHKNEFPKEQKALSPQSNIDMSQSNAESTKLGLPKTLPHNGTFMVLPFFSSSMFCAFDLFPIGLLTSFNCGTGKQVSPWNSREGTQSKLSPCSLNVEGKKADPPAIQLHLTIERPTEFLGYGVDEPKNMKSEEKSGLFPEKSPTSRQRNDARAHGHPENRHQVISSLRPNEWLVDHCISDIAPESPLRMVSPKQQPSSRSYLRRSLPPAPIQIEGVGSGHVSNSPFRNASRISQMNSAFAPKMQF